MEQMHFALTADDTVRMYGLPGGTGHAVIIPVSAMNDPLCVGGMVDTGCGGKGLDASRAVEKFTGDRMCVRCEKFLATEKGRLAVELATQAKYARYAEEREEREEREESAPVAPAEGETRAACDGYGKVPAPGTRVSRKDHAVSVPDDFNGPHAAKCPGKGCGRIIAVSREGVMRRHNAPPVRESVAVAPVAPEVRESVKGEGKRYPTTKRDVTPGFDRRASAPVEGRCGVHYRRNGSGWEAFAGTLPGAVSGTGRTLDTATDAMLANLRAAEDEFIDDLFAPEIGTDGKPWTPGDDPARRVAGNEPVAPKRVAARRPVRPAGDPAGEVLQCAYKGAVDKINMEGTHGKCPECSTYIPLQDVKSNDPKAQRIGTHNVRGLATPSAPAIALSSVSIDTVEHGTVPGAPAEADKRRAAEHRCVKSNRLARGREGANGGGMIPCPECGKRVTLVKKISNTKKGTKIKWQVPMHGRPMDGASKVDSFRGGPGGYVKSERKVTPCGSGADAGKGQREHGSVNGSANTGRVSLPPVQPTRGWLAVAGTMTLGATSAPGVDPGVSGKWCPVCQDTVDVAHRGMTRAARRRHSQRVAKWHREEDARRAATRDREVKAGRQLPAGARRAARKAASVGSFSEGTQAAVGTVAHGERPAVASKVTPRGKTRTAK